MSASNIIGFFHFLSLFMLIAGLSAVMFPLYWAWGSGNLQSLRLAFDIANLAQSLMVAGAIFTGITGVVWALEIGYNLVTTGWLLALGILHIFILLVCIPIISLGLQRVRSLSLQAGQAREITPELQEALADNVPLVFGTITILLLPVMVWLVEFKPF